MYIYHKMEGIDGNPVETRSIATIFVADGINGIIVTVVAVVIIVVTRYLESA